MTKILALLRSLPRFVLVQIVGLIALTALRPYLKTVAEPDQYIPHLTWAWSGLCLLGYMADLLRGSAIRSIRREAFSSLPEIALTIATISWAFGLGIQLLAIKAYAALALCYGLYHRRLYNLSPLHWLFVGFVLCSSLGILWSQYPAQGWKVIEMQMALVALPLTDALMPTSPSHLNRTTQWLCRLCFSFITLQIAQYIYLSTFYAEHLWDCFSFDKTYLAPGFVHIVYKKLMLWSHVIHPSLWLLFLAPPYLLQWHAHLSRLGQSCECHHRQDLISLSELTIYSIGLVLFAFITQPRYGLWVAFVALGWQPLLWLMARLPRRVSASALIGIVCLFTISTTWVVDLFQEGERRAMLENALTYIRSTWPWGGGLGADTQIQFAAFEHRHSHNALLTLLVDMGLWGGFLWFALFAGTIWLCVGRQTRQNLPFLLYFLLLLLLLLVDSVLYVSLTLPLIALYVCLLGSERERGVSNTPLHHTPNP